MKKEKRLVKFYPSNGKPFINPVKKAEREIMERMGLKTRNQLHKLKKKLRQNERNIHNNKV